MNELIQNAIEVWLCIGYCTLICFSYHFFKAIKIRRFFRFLGRLLRRLAWIIKSIGKRISLSKNIKNKNLEGVAREVEEDLPSNEEEENQNLPIPAYCSRKFLNLPNKQSNAYIRIDFNSSEYDDYVIEVKDCGSAIHLHGSLKSISSIENAQFKVKTLLDELKKADAFLSTHMNALLKVHEQKVVDNDNGELAPSDQPT